MVEGGVECVCVCVCVRGRGGERRRGIDVPTERNWASAMALGQRGHAIANSNHLAIFKFI